jgi:hypothetical protein
VRWFHVAWQHLSQRQGSRRRRRVASLCFLALLCASDIHATPAPDAVVIVFSTPGKPDTVSVAYRKPVNDETGKQDVRTLAQRGHWTAKNVAISHKGGSVARLEATGIVNLKVSTLPIAPIIETFKRFRALRIMFLINGAPTNFFPNQPPVSANEQVKLSFLHLRNNYTFDVEVLNSDFQSVELPSTPPPLPPAPVETTPAAATSGLVWWAMGLILLGGLGGGAIWFVCHPPSSKSSARKVKME